MKHRIRKTKARPKKAGLVFIDNRGSLDRAASGNQDKPHQFRKGARAEPNKTLTRGGAVR